MLTCLLFTSATYIQVHFRPFFHESKQGSSLILVHIVCNIGFLKTEADERADVKRRDWREKSELAQLHVVCQELNQKMNWAICKRTVFRVEVSMCVFAVSTIVADRKRSSSHWPVAFCVEHTGIKPPFLRHFY